MRDINKRIMELQILLIESLQRTIESDDKIIKLQEEQIKFLMEEKYERI